ncbi:MAG TPA: thiamine phosphate synthase, partial [bacterium]
MDAFVVNRKIDWSLYAILDKRAIGTRDIRELAEQIIAGGAGIIQLRDKISPVKEFYEDSLAVKEITTQLGVPLIINDRVDIALAVKAEGVHLGQDDLPFDTARRLLGEQRMLGASVHSLEEYRAAQKGRPNYLGVGTIYSSNTKNGLKEKGCGLVQRLRSMTDLPIVGIGGITVDNLEPVLAAGADGVAVIAGLLDADNVYERATRFVA